MAFPTTVTTDGRMEFGFAGPFVGSNGNVYCVVVDDDRFDIRALRGVDPSTAFSAVATDIVIGAGIDLIQYISGKQHGDNIHVLTKNSEGADPVDIRYHVFNMASETWTISNEMVKTNMLNANSNVGFLCGIDLAVKSDGSSVYAIYNGPFETVATVQQDRVHFARRIAGTWSVDIALSTAGAATTFVGGRAIRGSADAIHFFFADYPNFDLYARTLTDAGSLEPTASIGSPLSVSMDDAERSFLNIGAFVTATGVVSLPVYNSFETLHTVRAVSSNTPAWSVSADITGARGVLTNPIRWVASHAVDGNRLYTVFIDTANDIYYTSNDGGAWTTPVLLQTGSASAVAANVYTRSSALVLGVLYHDTNIVYTELTLSAIAAGGGSAHIGRMMLTGVGH